MVMQALPRPVIAGIAIVLLLCARPASAQSTYFWNYSGTDPALAGSWSPGGGPPTAADTAVISTFDAPVYNLPNFGANAAYGQLVILGPRPAANVPFIGNGNTLTLGTGGSMTGPAPSCIRGDFASMIQLDNLRINIANGTTMPTTGFGQFVVAVDLTGKRGSLRAPHRFATPARQRFRHHQLQPDDRRRRAIAHSRRSTRN